MTGKPEITHFAKNAKWMGHPTFLAETAMPRAFHGLKDNYTASAEWAGASDDCYP
jgi:hypothetical protein